MLCSSGSRRSITPLAADKVRVLWWNGERWGASGPFGIVTMPLDEALDYIATEPAFWIHA